MTTLVQCECHGGRHVVCRPGAWAAANPRAFLDADKSAPPPLAKAFDCGCRGAVHPVCEPRWKAIKEKPEAKPAKRMTLKQALKAGLELRPHVEHAYTCPPGCVGTHLYKPAPIPSYEWQRRRGFDVTEHAHFCGCDTEAPRRFCDHERGTTVRVPIEGRG